MTGAPIQHGVRDELIARVDDLWREVHAVVATALARKMGLGEDVASDRFYTALLLHVGCTRFAHETAVAGFSGAA